MAGTSPARRRRLATSLPVAWRRLIVSSCISIVRLPPARSYEQRRHGLFVVDAADRLTEQRRDGQHGDARRELRGGHDDRVGHDDLFERRRGDPLHRGARQDRVDAAREAAPPALARGGTRGWTLRSWRA